MRGNMKVSIVVPTWVLLNAVVGPAWGCSFVLIMVATWIWWNARAVARRPRVCTSKVAEQPTHNYKIVTFTTAGATKANYTQFIEALRAQLKSGEERHGIPVMRERSTVPDSERFVLVELSNSAADSPVTLAVDVTNAYVVAYRTGRRSFLLPEAIRNPFPGTEPPYTLSFSGNYRGLQNWGGNRGTIDLGMVALENATTALRNSNMGDQGPIARSLIVVIQMVAEAARFGYIKDLVCQSINIRPDPFMLSLEQNWKALSKAIQQSNEGGFFTTGPVLLHGVAVGSVRDCSERTKIAIMLFVPIKDVSSNPTKRGSFRAPSSKGEKSSLWRKSHRNPGSHVGMGNGAGRERKEKKKKKPTSQILRSLP